MTNILNVCQNLFNDWNNNNVRYCHWKGSNRIVNGLTGVTDLDILVDENHNQLATDILQKNGFKLFLTQWGIRYKGIQDWIALDNATGKFVHIHYHNYMIMGHTGVMEYNFPLQKEILDTRILLNDYGVYVPNPNYELVSFFVRIGLEYPNKKLEQTKDGYVLSQASIEEISYLKERSSEAQIKKILNTIFYNYSLEVYSIISKLVITSKEIRYLSRLTKKIFKGENTRCYNIIKSRCVIATMRYIFPFMNRISVFPTKKVLSPKKGLSIAFLGQDGSGKSTVVKDIHKWLSWKIEVSQLYLGNGDHYWPWEKKLQLKLNNKNSFLCKLLRMWLPFKIFSKLGKDVLKKIIRAQKYVSKGGIVLFDRYPQMQYPGINDGPKIRTSLKKYTKGFLKPVILWYAKREEYYLNKAVQYQPSLVFKLMLSPEESMRRKPHENGESIKQKHEIIKTLDFKSSSVYNIDATQPYEDELLEIKRIIWNHLTRSII